MTAGWSPSLLKATTRLGKQCYNCCWRRSHRESCCDEYDCSQGPSENDAIRGCVGDVIVSFTDFVDSCGNTPTSNRPKNIPGLADLLNNDGASHRLSWPSEENDTWSKTIPVEGYQVNTHSGSVCGGVIVSEDLDYIKIQATLAIGYRFIDVFFHKKPPSPQINIPAEICLSRIRVGPGNCFLATEDWSSETWGKEFVSDGTVTASGPCLNP